MSSFEYFVNMERDNLSYVKQYLKSCTNFDWRQILADVKYFKSHQKFKKKILASETRDLVDYNTTKSGILQRSQTPSGSSSPKTKVFRRRFRTPYNLFAYIVERCKEA